jgi:predicted Zn-dependent protease
MSRRLWSSVAAPLVALALLAGCATNPVTGHRELTLVSSSQLEQIGREGHQAVLAEYGAYDQQGLQGYVDSVGRKVAAASHEPKLDWHFTLIDDASVNAFAMPGGYIYITRGILVHLGSEAQLAGVLGHEVGHVTARHAAQRITQTQLASLGLGLAQIFTPGFSRYSGAAEAALGLMFLKYGRDDENQADQLGVEYAARAGYDPREIPNTYRMLQRVGERSGQRLPGFLSTHPDPGDRQSRTAALARDAAAGKTGLVVRERVYLTRLDGVLYGRDPRQGYFENEHYYHPELSFQMTFPSGWQYQDTKRAVMAVGPQQRAAEQLTVAPRTALSPAEYVRELQRTGRIAGADGASETIGGYQAWVGRVLVVGENNTQSTLVAAWIRKSADQMFQVLGMSPAAGDADEGRIIASIRSFRALTDPQRLNATPDRVDVRSAPRAGEFTAIVSGFGAQAIPIEETAVLNNVDPGENVLPGQLVKIVVPGRRR